MNALIAVLPGDGVGPEVIGQAVRVLQRVAEVFGHAFELREALIGGIATDTAGSPLPDQTLALCKGADAVLLGAVGGPRWDGADREQRPEHALLVLRKELGVYANLRPVRVGEGQENDGPLRPDIARGVDLLIVRELTGGIYFGERGKGDGWASDRCLYTAPEIERVARVAFTLARARRGHVTSVDKANVLETSRLWRATVTALQEREFPGVTLAHQLVDSCAMRLVTEPASFDVVLTENMFGDILSDEASVLVGSLGLLGSASVGDADARTGRTRGLYEPIHGSAPDIAGRGIATPIGAIASAAMMLRQSLGLPAEADAVERALARVLRETGGAHSNGQPGFTERVGDAVVRAVVAEGEL